MKTYAIVNVSRKGLWPENENVTLVRAESREEIIKTILRGQDSFVERRLTPCHEYLRNLFKKFRGEAISEEEDELGEQVEEVEKRKESQLKEDQMAKRILKEVRRTASRHKQRRPALAFRLG